jgi:predicted dehydrogenase
VGVAVVGLGYWGPNLLRVLADNLDAEVLWLCDLDEERLVKYGRRYPAAGVTTSVDRVISDPRVEAVVIATPLNTHYELAARVIEAGKHAFVEKPLATSCQLVDDLVEMACARRRVLMCGHTFIYSPPVRAVKSMLKEGTLGEIYFVSSSRVNLGLHQRDTSVIWDLGPHDFSILLYWLGEAPTSVRTVGRDSIVKGIADVAFISLQFASGIIANVELSWLAPSKLRRTVLVGSERMVIYDDGALEPVRVFDSGVVYRDPETFGEYHLSYRSGDILSPKIDSDEPLALELADFLKAIRAEHNTPVNTSLARDVVRIVEAADWSLREGGREVTLDPSEGSVPLTGLSQLALR